MKDETTIIEASTLFDGKTKKENVFIIIKDGLIEEVTSKKIKADLSGIVTPAFIDAHSHIGMARAGEPGGEEESNDKLSQFNPLNDPLNSVYFDDPSFPEACDFGVLYSCIVPGSGNILGGRAKIIRNFAQRRDEALLKDYGFKIALGFNPRSTGEWKGDRPNTRMGTAALLEKKFDSVIHKHQKAVLAKEKRLHDLEYRARKEKIAKLRVEEEKQHIIREYSLELDSEENAILEILMDKKPVKVHVHKEDDILYLIELKKKYHLNVTAEHCCDAHSPEIFNALADAEIPIAYGPLGTFAYKVELKNENYKNIKLLMESRATYGLITDHPVILTTWLKDSLKFFLMHGMKEEDAISLITRKNAEILGINDILGSVESGKKASLLIWKNDPFKIGSMPAVVMAEGKIIRG